MYRSPNTPEAFWKNFNSSLEKALESNSNIVIVGGSQTKPVRQKVSPLHCQVLNNLINVITRPTQVTRVSETLIDSILVTDPVDVILADTLDTDPINTDHKATLVFLKFTFVSMVCSKRTVLVLRTCRF